MLARSALRALLPSVRLLPRKSNLLLKALQQPSLPLNSALQPRYYFPERQLMQRHEGPVLHDPNDVAERVIKVVSLHDSVRDPSAVAMRCSFKELGVNELDLVEIMLMLEEEFAV